MNYNLGASTETLVRSVSVREQAERWDVNTAARLEELDGFTDPAYRALINLNCNYLKRDVPTTARDVIDVGCGLGYLAQAVAQSGYNVLGIDPASRQIEEARRMGEELPGLRFEAASVEDYARRADRSEFDVAIANMTLHNMPQLATGLYAITEVLRPEGRLLVTIPNPETYLQGRSDLNLRGVDLRVAHAFELMFRIHGHTPHPAQVFFFHRPIKDYLSAAIANGLFPIDFNTPEQIGVGRARDVTFLAFKKASPEELSKISVRMRA